MQGKYFTPSLTATMKIFAHLSCPWSIVGWVALSFLVCSFVCPAMVTSDQISTFFNMYRHKSVVLTQFHLTPRSTKLHWPRTTKYQPIPPHTDPTPPNTNQYRLLLTQYYHISTSSASYWPSNIIYQSVLSYTDQVPSCINQFRYILIQHHQIGTSTAPYWSILITNY